MPIRQPSLYVKVLYSRRIEWHAAVSVESLESERIWQLIREWMGWLMSTNSNHWWRLAFNHLWPLHLLVETNPWFVGLVYPMAYDRKNRKRGKRKWRACATVGIWFRSWEIVQAITSWDLLSTKLFFWSPGWSVFVWIRAHKLVGPHPGVLLGTGHVPWIFEEDILREHAQSPIYRFVFKRYTGPGQLKEIYHLSASFPIFAKSQN